MKTYIKPNAKVKQVKLAHMVAASNGSGLTGDDKWHDGDHSESGDLSGRHRGSWGNLWGDKQKVRSGLNPSVVI